ncbi:hypothetical protein OS493_025312 [Desmophyllum pertusum]|uniref:Uncharacterized protein n=1 Tax=Desmophyllum pertusum TaxID=174260 RepID=A0A9X0CWC8_9CNID|nr:hypothetical protein OS493_025312 [Desmophyllum pertusum]
MLQRDLRICALMLESVKSASVKPGSVFTIADYAAQDGGTSMPLLYACVKELRKTHGDDLPIHVVYEDQPVNDFKSLYLRLQGLIPGPKKLCSRTFPTCSSQTCGHKLLQSMSASSVFKLGFFLHCHGTGCVTKPCNVTGALTSHN